MDTLEALGKRIATTEDLRAIVRTMKSLSAASIRQYDQAVIALRDYSRTIEMGLQIVLRSAPPPVLQEKEAEGATIAVVFGSDHGLCGRFNTQITKFSRLELHRRKAVGEKAMYLVVGARAAAQLEVAGEPVRQSFILPGSVEGLTGTAHDVLRIIDEWRDEATVAQVLVFHNMRLEGAIATPRLHQLLPLDPEWFRHLGQLRWPSRVLPTSTMNTRDLFAALVRQHLFIELFRAGAESAASEHAMRLSSMQAAERNIKEQLEDMSAAYRRKRQQSITEELLDIVAGFEILEASPESYP